MTEEQATLAAQTAEHRRILDFIMEIGRLLLENGAEVFRVEQTMQHIAQGYQLPDFHVFVITSGIFASTGEVGFAQLRNVPSRRVHLGRVVAMNAISRQITAGELSIAQAEQALAEAAELPLLSAKTRVLASGFGAFSFCFLFGGGVLEALVSLCAGAVLGGYLHWCDTRSIESLFQRLTGAALVSAFCMLVSFALSALAIDASAAIVGAFMILTPGVAFTLAIRDFVRADYLSGTIRMIDAVLIATSIAIGAGLLIWAQQLLLGGAL